MNNTRNMSSSKKTDVISVILESNELLNAFSDTLETFDVSEEKNLIKEMQEKSHSSLSKIQKFRLFLWENLLKTLHYLALKIQTWAILVEYHFKNEVKKVQKAIIGEKMIVYKNNLPERDDEDHPDISHIPNDQPIPEIDPNKRPVQIPMKEPTNPPIPGPLEAPTKEPTKKPGIRVLNIEA